MPRAISLHIGLNNVDSAAYGGPQPLSNCINDARSMQRIAESRGYETSILLDGQATSLAVTSAISRAARDLNTGDYFLITYSGHGSQVLDEEGLESDGLNETWCLYDRQLIDNELYRLWSTFDSGVRLFVLSDSCHSGTVVRMLMKNAKANSPSRGTRTEPLHPDEVAEINIALEQRKTDNSDHVNGKSRGSGQPDPIYRELPFDVSYENYIQNRDMYRNLNLLAGPRERNPVTANLVLISGCQDNQLSSDGLGSNGLFTEKLLTVWNNGSFNGSHRDMHSQILAFMPAIQTPNYLMLGPEIAEFIQQKPFSPQAGTSGSTTTSGGNTGSTTGNPNPRISAPATWGNSGEGPVFQIYKGANPYYYVEVTTDNRLFNFAQFGTQRSQSNYYATWADQAVGGRLTADTFRLPAAVWDRLKQGARLYFRIGSTSSASPLLWENFMLSVFDADYANAPTLQLVTGNTGIPSGSGTGTGTSGTGGSSNGSGGTGSGGATSGNTAAAESISGSVGPNAQNSKTDVKKVQSLLNRVAQNQGGPTTRLVQDGLYGSKTGAAITRFQEAHGIESGHSEYRFVRSGSTTLSLLNQFAN